MCHVDLKLAPGVWGIHGVAAEQKGGHNRVIVAVVQGKRVDCKKGETLYSFLKGEPQAQRVCQAYYLWTSLLGGRVEGSLDYQWKHKKRDCQVQLARILHGP